MRFTIRLHPTTKKNSQQIIYVKGRPMIIQSAKYKQYEKDCKYFMPNIKTIDVPVNIKYTFYRKDKRLCDLNGLIQAIDDILVHYKIIKDDNFNIVVGHDGSRVKIDKENPRTEIEISVVEE